MSGSIWSTIAVYSSCRKKCSKWYKFTKLSSLGNEGWHTPTKRFVWYEYRYCGNELKYRLNTMFDYLIEMDKGKCLSRVLVWILYIM